MKTIDDIVSVAATLDTDQLIRLRKKLQRLEEKAWERELAKVTEKMKAENITEDEIDRRVLRRRRESRS